MSRAAIVGVGAVLPVRTDAGMRVDRDDPDLARARRQMARGAFLAALAVRDALTDAAGRGVVVDPARTAAFLAVGPSTGPMDDVLRILAASTESGTMHVERFARKGVAACHPLLAFQLMNNFTLCHAAIREGLQGPNGAFFGHATADVLREGLRALEEVPWALVGAADSRHHPVVAVERRDEAGEPGEAAVVLLLAREAASPIGWVDQSGFPAGDCDEIRAKYGDCGVAQGAIGWVFPSPFGGGLGADGPSRKGGPRPPRGPSSCEADAGLAGEGKRGALSRAVQAVTTRGDEAPEADRGSHIAGEGAAMSGDPRHPGRLRSRIDRDGAAMSGDPRHPGRLRLGIDRDGAAMSGDPRHRSPPTLWADPPPTTTRADIEVSSTCGASGSPTSTTNRADVEVPWTCGGSGSPTSTTSRADIEVSSTCGGSGSKGTLFRPAGGGQRGPVRITTSRPPRRAVITGVGVASPFGLGTSALLHGLLRGGAPAFAPAPHLPGFPPVGAVPGSPALPLDPSVRDRWAALGWLRDRRLLWTIAAATEAWDAAGRPSGLALSLALGLEQAFLEDFLPLLLPTGLDWSRDPGGPTVRYRSALDLPARALRELLPFSDRAPLVHASACAGGTLAVAHAAAWVVEDGADVVLCGGADSMLNPLGLAGLQKLGVTSPRQACRPFDLRRDGIVVGEGAGCFVVEELAYARRRGAPILAEVAGWGSTQDGHAPTAPRPGGEPARRAMETALRRAGRAPADIAWVNAHGTGTPLNDEAEATAIQALLPGVPVNSFKGAIGHAMAAAGAIELAGCVLALAEGVIPGTVGFETADPRCAIDVVRTPRQGTGAVIKNSFGFGGQDASVVIVPWTR